MQPTQRRVLAIVSVATFMAGLDLFIVNIAFPDIRASLPGTSTSALSWVLSAYAIVFAALLVPIGRLSDLVGHKRVFMIGLVGFVAASALCAAAPSVPFLVGARVLQAAAAAALLPTSLALLLPEFPPARRPHAIAIWSMSGAVAAAAGPPLGGLLVQESWRWVFLVNLPVGLITAIVAVGVLREAPRIEGERRPDLAGAGLFVAAITALTLGIVKGPDWGWGSDGVILAFAGAAAGLALFARRCARHPAPVVELDLLRVRAFASANIASLIFNAAFAVMLLGGVLFLTGVWHHSVLRAGLELSPGPLTAALFSVPGGMLVARYGQRIVAPVGLVVYALGALWLRTHLGADPHFASDYLPGMLLTGSGVGLTIGPLASASAGALPSNRFATGSAVFTMTRQLGAALGVSVLVAILGADKGPPGVAVFRSGWDVMIGCAVVAAGVAASMGHVGQAPAAVPAASASSAVAEPA